MEPKWSKMVILSIALHFVLFCSVFFVPESMPARRIKGTVYEVNLVELPTTTKAKSSTKSTVKTVKKKPISKKKTPAKRITMPKKKEKPVVIAKRTVTKKKKKKSQPSPTKLIDQAVSKIEKKVKKQKEDPVEEALKKVRDRVQVSEGERSGADENIGGIPLQIYRLEVESQIKGNWDYIIDPAKARQLQDLEAVVVVRAKADGTVIKYWFKKKSHNEKFDQSVIKAVERSEPLPHFPEGYRKTFEEIEINFNLKDLDVS
jgi:colicin import membrane protein